MEENNIDTFLLIRDNSADQETELEHTGISCMIYLQFCFRSIVRPFHFKSPIPRYTGRCLKWIEQKVYSAIAHVHIYFNWSMSNEQHTYIENKHTNAYRLKHFEWKCTQMILLIAHSINTYMCNMFIIII